LPPYLTKECFIVNKLYEELMPVMALEKTTVSGTDTTTATIPFGDFRRALFYVFLEAADGNFIKEDAAADGEVELTLIERKGLTGATNNLRTEIEIEWGKGVKKFKAEDVQQAGWETNDTLTIDGIEFKKVASEEDADDGTWENASGLKAAIEANIDYVSVTVSSTDHVTVEVDDPTTDSMDIDCSISASSNDERVNVLETAAIVEAHVSELTNEYTAVHLNIDDDDGPTGDVSATVICVMANPYSKPINKPVAVTS